MRIIAGKLRSRLIAYPKSKKTRPMTDRAKESIFGILGEGVSGVQVLDLFAGSGSLGLEALSRGAARVVFVERDPWASRIIYENLKDLDLERKASIIRNDVFLAIRILEKKGENFSLIFLDPPYNQGLVKKLLIRLDRSDIVSPLTQLIVHHSRQEKLPELPESFKVFREKRIGQACLSFLSKKS